MNPGRVWSLLRKDLKLGPRGPMFLFAILMPVAFTIIFQGAFGTLFEPRPRLGIVDAGQSEITRAAKQIPGIELTLLERIEDLTTRVRQNNLDAGLVLPAGFDEAVRSGERPQLEFFISGESLASNRIILSVTALDLIRAVEGGDPPVEVNTVTFGREGLPISIRVVPLLVFYALVIAGVFIPSSSLVEEKERRTLAAVMVTPARVTEVLAAKWMFGVILASVLALATLFLNRAFGPEPLDVIVVILIAAGLTAMLGIVAGLISRTSTELFTMIKGAGILLFAPVIFYIFPDWPQWIARLFPLYWIIEPVWQVSVMGEPLGAVRFELTVAVAITLGLIPLITVLGRRLQT